MKKLVLGVVLMVLAAGGAAAWKFGMPLLEEDPDAPPPIVESRYVKVPSLAVPVIRDGSLVEQFELEVQLEVAGAEGEMQAQAAMPRLHDVMLTELHGVVALRYVLEREDAIEIVRMRLLQAARRVIGEDALRHMLLTTINRRPASQVRAGG